MSGGTFQPRIICPGGHYDGGTSNPTTTLRGEGVIGHDVYQLKVVKV